MPAVPGQVGELSPGLQLKQNQASASAMASESEAGKALPPLPGLGANSGKGDSLIKPVLRSPSSPATPATPLSDPATTSASDQDPPMAENSGEIGEDPVAVEQAHATQASKQIVSRYAISPESTFRKQWDLSQALILVYISLAIPFRVAYKVNAQGPIYVFELAIDIYFYIDIILNFLTGYHDEVDSEIVMDLAMISKNYLKSWFTIDIVACLPIDFVYRIMDKSLVCSLSTSGCDTDTDAGEGTDGAAKAGQLLKILKMLRLFRLMKMLRLVRLSRLFERYQDELFHYLYLLSVGKSAVFLMYLGHIFGCVFYFFSNKDYRSDDEKRMIENGEMDAWLHSSYGDSEATHNVDERYIASIYWAFTTMTTVGYGDISANTKTERIVAIVGMIMGGFVFSIIISTMHEVVQNANLSKRAHTEKMQSVSAFIKDSKLPKDYTKAVLGFFRKQATKAYDERALLKEMPFELRHGILQHMYEGVICRVPFFDVDGDGSVDDHVFVTELCQRLVPQNFTKGSLVFQKGEIGTHMYIIVQGLVDILNPHLTKVLTVLERGSYFGEGAVLGDCKRRENARARTLCELSRLEMVDLDNLLLSYPHLKKQLVKTHKLRTGLFTVSDPEKFQKLAVKRSQESKKELERIDWDNYDPSAWYKKYAPSKHDPPIEVDSFPSLPSPSRLSFGRPAGVDSLTSTPNYKSSEEDTILISQESTRAAIEALEKAVEKQSKDSEVLHKKLDKILELLEGRPAVV